MRAWLLALVLLAAQVAGLAHRVVHTPLSGTGTPAATAQALGQDRQDQQRRIGADHQSGSADCRLFDQLLHADALCVAAAVTAALALPADNEIALQAEAARATSAALYLARAPPRVSRV
jgi:hypothetical protein